MYNAVLLLFVSVGFFFQSGALDNEIPTPSDALAQRAARSQLVHFSRHRADKPELVLVRKVRRLFDLLRQGAILQKIVALDECVEFLQGGGR